MNTANEQTIVDNLIDTAGSLASGLSGRADVIRQYYIEGASTQKALVEAYLNDMARSFREHADKALYYMNLADASDLGTRSVYYYAYEYYVREANRLLDPAIDAKARLDMFLEGTKAELSKILNSEAIAKLGPLFDAAQMIGAVADGSVDRVGEVATGIVAAEALGSLGAFLGTAAARAAGVPGVVGAGIGAFAGAFAGNQAADKFFQEIFKPLAEAIPISVWDEYFDLGLWAGNKIPIEVWDKLFAGFDYSRESVRALIDTIRQRFSESKTIVSPIVLDLNGDGIDATSVAGGVYFDHDADRFAEKSGWVNTSDGLLVLDRNGNGVVDSGRELFGSETLLSSGSKAPNGFAALAEIDDNGDALIDLRDSSFSALRVWRDLDQDGQSDAGELQTLAEAGIASLGTTHTNTLDPDVSGNVTKQLGSFTRSDGTTGQSADIWFAVDGANTVSLDQIAIPPEIAALPNIAGIGKLDSLHQAMAKDGSGQLRQLVEQLVAATDVLQRRVLFDSILYAWAGAEDVAPDSRGYMPDARQLYVIEAFLGEGFIQGYGYNAGTPNTGPNAGAFLARVHQELADGLYDQFLIQGPLKPLFDSIDVAWDPLAGNFTWQVSGTVDALRLMWESGRAADLNEFALVLKRDSRDGVAILEALRAHGSASGSAFDAWLSTIGSFALVGDALDNTLTGTDSGDLLFGKQGNDVLDGGAGNDLLQGDQGNDVYVFNLGSGQDSVLDLDGSADVIRFGAGIAPDDLSFARHDYDIVVSINGTNDKITLRNWGGGASYRIERFEFADGTVWDEAQIGAQFANVPLVGGDGDDVLVAWAGQDSLLQGMAGNDQLFGFTGSDVLEGGLGNDQLVGAGGIDSLSGGEGNDKLFGDADQSPASEHGNDLLDGGTGDDYLRGYGGDDVLIAGDGNDTLQGDDGNDRLEGGAGADLMEGGAGSDTLFGGEGNDQLDGSAGDDTLSGGAGDDAYIVDSVLDSVVEALGEGDDVVFSTVSHTLADNVERLQLEGTAHIAGTGNALGNVIVGNLANNTLDGAAGNDQLYGEGGNDVLIGAGGDDQLVGGRGADSLSGGEDNDSLFGDADELPASAHGNDLMDGGAGNDYLRGYGGDDVLIGGDGDDTLQGDDGSDQLNGGLGIDGMSGGGGNDALLGGDGDDVMQGDATDGSIALASHGADHLDGGAGNDTLYGDGGADVVLGGDGDDTLSGDNGLAVLDATAHGDDTVDGGLGNDTLHGGGGNDVLLGGAGDDSLYGDDAALPIAQHGADTLDGGAGSDQLQGGGGNDVYVFARGYGNDTIFDRDATAGNADRIRLDGLRPQDIVLEREAGTYNLVVRILETNETLKVTNHFYLSEGGIAEHAVEAIEFADGTALTAAQIAQATVLQINGTGSDDTISGGSAGEFVRGFDGNDLLSGGPGNDWLDGGAGNDVLYGGDSDASGGGNDVFVWGRGGGQDTIIESLTEADQDVLRLVGLRPQDVTFTAQTADLVIAIEGTADRLRVQGYFSSGARTVETILFADGQAFDRAAVSQRIVSSITGTAGNDTLLGTTLADRIDGGAGNDTLYAYGSNDTLIGGAGNDTLNGDVGDDTYVFARGDGRDTIYDGSSTTNGGNADRVQFATGITPADLIFAARADLPPTDPDYDGVDRVSSDDLIVTLRDSGDRILIDGFFSANGRIESFVFADGTVVTSGQVLDALRRTDGTSGDDALRGGVSADTIMGLDGNDTARGFDGDDLIDGGAGNDRLFGDEGNDMLLGGSGDDTLRGGTGDDRLDGGAGYDTVYGEDGNDVLVAGADGAYLEGGAGDDVLDSGAGGVSTRTVEYRGGAGNDTYVLRVGMGRVTITDRDAQVAAIDVVQLADFRSSDVRIAQDGNKLSITSIANPNDVLELYRLWESTDPYNNITAPDRLIDRIRFADGTELTVDQLIAASAGGTFAADTLRGTNADDTIDGNAGNDWIYGHLGDDVVRGGDGDDRLFGMHGSDRLEGGAGNDTLDGAGDWTASGDGTNTLIGGAGNDRNIGGLGNDIVVFGRGDGSDTIEDTNGGAADTLQLGNGVLPEHVALYRDGTDLVVVIDGSNTQTRIKSFYSLTNRPIERIVFDGGAGAVWDIAQMEANAISGAANAMTGTADDDVFIVDNALDTVTEAANSGIDEVRSSVTFVLPANVENFTATGVLNLTIRGNTLDNVLRGNAGDNEFRVSGGYDRGLGGLGNDSYYIERDSMGTVGLVNPEENTDEGVDTVFQVSGDWAYSYYSVTLPQNVERLVLGNSTSHWYNSYTGDYDPRGGYGNSGDNEIYGEVAAENYLDGAGGRDVLIGGSAGDVYVVDSDDDTIVDPTQGEYSRNQQRTTFSGSNTLMRNGDLVFSYAANYALPDRVENLQLRGAGNINGTGNAERNVIVGNSGNNRVDGSGGDDQLFDQEPQYAGSPYYALDADLLLGGDGNDTLTSHLGSDVLDGGAGNDTFVAYGRVALIQGGDGNDTITASGGGDLIDGGAGDDSINGWGAVATLAGGTGNDTLTGSGRGSVFVFNRGDGDDTLSPGFNNRDGQDRLVFGTGVAAADVTMERVGTDGNDLLLRLSDGGGSVLVRSYFAASVPDGYRNYALASIEFADGTVWRRNAVDGYFGLPVDPEGTDGDDILLGTAARNVLYAHGGNDQVAGQAGSDDLFGGTGDDVLLGEDGSDSLYGEAGNDLLDGGLGYDVLIGGAGDDTYRDADGSFSISEGVGEGTDTQEIGTSGSLSQNVENGIIVTAAGGTVYGNDLNNTLIGNAGADRLEGGAGNDLLDGAAGADTMLGGAGDDRYIVDNASDVTTENANEGNDTVESSVTRTLGANLENLTLTGTAAINGTGNSLANVIIGNAANNTLSGGTGADTLRGGAGNDTYVVDNVGDVVQEIAGEGTDLVQASVNFTLSANVENLTLTGTSGLTGIGNDEANTLTGNSGANRLEGRGGNDTLNGGTGADTMLGGLGDDVYVVDNAGDVVTENANEGIDRVQSSVAYTLGNNVENLTLTGTGAINGTGNALDNVLIGNSGSNTLNGGAGNDRLDGGSGTDTLAGGTGDDTYVLNASTGKTLTENANEGTDTVESSVTHTLLTNFEHLVLTGANAINGTGNAANNHIRGNSANNTLNGGGGNDVLQGGAGNDTLTDTSGRGVHDGGDGTDTLTGGTDRQFFAGGAGNDTLTLGGGADIVAFNRGQGADVVNAPTAGTGQGETNDTVSLAGVRYAELRLARSGNDLYVKVAGTTDSIRLTGWYAATGNRTVSTLQLIVDSTADHDAASSDPLVNRRIARLNFQTLVGAFDAAYNTNPSIGDWAIPPATLSTALVASSDTDAIGGQLAYRYGRDGNLAGLDFATASAVLADVNFGTAAQSIGSGPTSGGVRLMRVSATAPETGELDARVSTGTPLLSRTAPLADDAPAASKLPSVQGVAADAERAGLPRLLGRWLGEVANADSGFWLKRPFGAKLVAADAQPALPAIAICELAQPEADARVAGAPHSATGGTLDGSMPSLPAATDHTAPLLASKLRPLTAAMVDATIAGAARWGATGGSRSINAGPVERTAIADEGQPEGSSLAGLPRALARFASTDASVSARWQRVEAYLRADQRVGVTPTLGGEELVDTGSLQQIGLSGAALAIDESQRSMRAVRRTMVA